MYEYVLFRQTDSGGSGDSSNRGGDAPNGERVGDPSLVKQTSRDSEDAEANIGKPNLFENRKF